MEPEYKDSVGETDGSDLQSYVPQRSTDWSQLIGGAMGLSLVLLTFWGMGWSFYRHGPAHGLAAMFIPPYAWYRGVAYVWDEPKWKENWDEMTETVGTIVVMSIDNESALQLIRFKDRARNWISSLPHEDKVRLRKKVDSFGDAFIQVSRNIIEALYSSSEVPPITHPSVETFVKGFSDDRGLLRAWGQIKAPYKTARPTLETVIAQSDPEKRQELLQDRDRIRLLFDMQTEEIRGAIVDLFEEDHRQ